MGHLVTGIPEGCRVYVWRGDGFKPRFCEFKSIVNAGAVMIETANENNYPLLITAKPHAFVRGDNGVQSVGIAQDGHIVGTHEHRDSLRFGFEARMEITGPDDWYFPGSPRFHFKGEFVVLPCAKGAGMTEWAIRDRTLPSEDTDHLCTDHIGDGPMTEWIACIGKRWRGTPYCEMHARSRGLGKPKRPGRPKGSKNKPKRVARRRKTVAKSVKPRPLMAVPEPDAAAS